MGWHDYFPPSRPREAKGGIKAQSRRGVFGESWWAKRWIAVLESFNIGARLDRGRSYARKGQVLSISIDKGHITAQVQGSRPDPYDVAISVKVLATADWKKLAKRLSQQALFAAKLLAGEMPQDIEKEFTDLGLSLFPTQLEDLETDCSCPDWSNPCKHIAAVYYLLGEEFNRDPFLIFKLRGMHREEWVKLFDVAGGKIGKTRDQSLPTQASQEKSLPLEPLTVDGFWEMGKLPEDFWGEVRVPPLPAALPKRLESFPFWRGEERFLEALEPLYSQASSLGLEIFLLGR
jgi:uncharacterized Zn finger protein